ncbi:MAG: DUF1816 domain-containing protein [Leptolyngbyaceae cyanobacterium MO_188.B28]|nr:DUF1816 domain-containing protein [Leptolyngbyaceae cyanobacterium MO_188.B28]
MDLSGFRQSYSKQSPLAWWIKVHTSVPSCTYYFGPFDSEAEAKRLQVGYVEDLLEENAKGIDVEIKQCHPETLTDFVD